MSEKSGSAGIDRKIAEVGGWRGEALRQMRRMIREADPDAVESIKWRKAGNPSGVPVWEHAGILCTGETYKQYIKLTFARGASCRQDGADTGALDPGLVPHQEISRHNATRAGHQDRDVGCGCGADLN